MRKVLLSLVCLAGFSGLAGAEEVADMTSLMAGPWEFSDANNKTCRIEFSAEAAIHGFSATPEAGCKDVWAKAEDISGWTLLPDGSLRLLDPLGKSLMDFPESENGLYQHLTDGKSDYALANVDEKDFIESPPTP